MPLIAVHSLLTQVKRALEFHVAHGLHVLHETETQEACFQTFTVMVVHIHNTYDCCCHFIPPHYYDMSGVPPLFKVQFFPLTHLTFQQFPLNPK